jgi:hypothetical protein
MRLKRIGHGRHKITDYPASRTALEAAPAIEKLGAVPVFFSMTVGTCSDQFYTVQQAQPEVRQIVKDGKLCRIDTFGAVM